MISTDSRLPARLHTPVALTTPGLAVPSRTAERLKPRDDSHCHGLRVTVMDTAVSSEPLLRRCFGNTTGHVRQGSLRSSGALMSDAAYHQS